MLELVPVVDENGKSPYIDWLGSLDIPVRARITIAVLRLEHGVPSTAKSVGAGVSELRLFFGPGYRVYFAVVANKLLLLLAGGSKGRQDRDILAAQDLLRRYNQQAARGDEMITTVSHNEMITQDLKTNRDFRRAFLAEAIISLVSGETATGKSALRLYVDATIGFNALGVALDEAPERLESALAQEGNPSAESFLRILATLQKTEGTQLRFQAADTRAEEHRRAA